MSNLFRRWGIQLTDEGMSITSTDKDGRRVKAEVALKPYMIDLLLAEMTEIAGRRYGALIWSMPEHGR